MKRRGGRGWERDGGRGGRWTGGPAGRLGVVALSVVRAGYGAGREGGFAGSVAAALPGGPGGLTGPGPREDSPVKATAAPARLLCETAEDAGCATRPDRPAPPRRAATIPAHGHSACLHTGFTGADTVGPFSIIYTILAGWYRWWGGIRLHTGYTGAWHG